MQSHTTELKSSEEFDKAVDNLFETLRDQKDNIAGVLVITYGKDSSHEAHMLGNFEVLGSLALDCAEALLKDAKAETEEKSPILLLN